MLQIHSKLIRPTKTEVYNTYWKFAAERQNIFFNRINNRSIWTRDEILIKHKFTNAYRASDRVSQYLIRNIIYNYSQDSKEVLFRILLFKTFNKIETWEFLERHIGKIEYKTFDFDIYDKILTDLMNSGTSIYSGAYIMSSGRSVFGYSKKHRNHLKLIEHIIDNGLTEKIKSIESMKNLFDHLKTFPTIGDFLAYQYCIDINYSEVCDFNEMDFVQPGPGALDGIKKCFSDFGDFDQVDLIKYVTENQEAEFEKLNLKFKDLWGRKLQLIDCQNLFCEVDKYARVAHPNINGISGRKRIKQIFKPKKEEIKYWYPPKWKINSKIN